MHWQLKFSLISVASWAQSEHLAFKGVPIDGTLREYTAKMKEAGFAYLGEQDGIAALRGDFAGYKNCTIAVATLKSTNVVNTIGVIFPEQDTWSRLYSNYSSLKEMLTTKYGRPAECIEKFESNLQPDDDNDRLYELKMDRCKYVTLYKTDKGNIELSIEHQGFSSCFVKLQYWDKINTDTVRQQAMDDL